MLDKKEKQRTAAFFYRKMLVIETSPRPSPSRALLSMINYFVMLNLVQHLTNMALYLFSGKIPKQVRDDIFVYSLFHILFSHNIYLHSFLKFLYKIILDNSAEHGREHFCYSSSLSRNFLITNHQSLVTYSLLTKHKLPHPHSYRVCIFFILQ